MFVTFISFGGSILGDFFLRSAYVVYDLENNLVGIAQTNMNSSSSNVLEVPEGVTTIPQLAAGSSYASFPVPPATTTETGTTTTSSIQSSGKSTDQSPSYSSNNPGSTPTITSTNTRPGTQQSNTPAPTKNQAAQVSVGRGIVGIALLAAAVGSTY